MTVPLVSHLTPTMGRAELHQQLYEGFYADAWPNKELVVLDESQDPSPFFSKLGDLRVVYVHAPAEQDRSVNRIGRARNKLVALSHGAFLFHRDDDDWYHPDWTRFMLGKLGTAALAKLDVYRIITDAPEGQRLVLEWDTRQFGGKHYALRGCEVQETDVNPSELPSEIIEMFRDGYGYSLCGPRCTFERFPFPEEGTEDFKFLRDVRNAGGRIEFVSDGAHLVMHLVSKRSKSMVFPQKIVGTAGTDGDILQAFAARKMIGLMGTMQELPSGKPIRLKPGATYSVLASIKDEHTLPNIVAQAEKWGVHARDARDNVSPSEFGVPAPSSGYRLVHVTASTDKDAEMPWSAPAPFNVFDRSSVVRAWSSAPAGLGFVHPAMLGLGASYSPDSLCAEMMQLGDGSWSQVISGSCSDVLNDVQQRAAVQTDVVFAIWSWDATQNQWTDPTYYNQPTTVTGSSGPITTVTPPCQWTALPDGQDVGIKSGFTYSGIASVSKNYSKQDIVSAMGSNYALLDYAEQGQRPNIPVDSDTNHRTVVATVRALKDGDDLPWSSPWPTTIFSLVHMWVSAPANACSVKPPAPLGTASNPFVPIFVTVGLGVAAAGGWWYWSWRRKHRKLPHKAA